MNNSSIKFMDSDGDYWGVIPTKTDLIDLQSVFWTGKDEWY